MSQTSFNKNVIKNRVNNLIINRAQYFLSIPCTIKP